MICHSPGVSLVRQGLIDYVSMSDGVEYYYIICHLVDYTILSHGTSYSKGANTQSLEGGEGINNFERTLREINNLLQDLVTRIGVYK